MWPKSFHFNAKSAQCRAVRNRAKFLLLALWIAAILASLAIDRPVAEWVRDRKPLDKQRPTPAKVAYVIKLPGAFIPFTACLCVMLIFVHERRAIAALCLAASSILVGAAYQFIKWAAGRHRPVKIIDPLGFHPFIGGWRGFFNESALSFPSGHAALSFATAGCLTVLFPRRGALFFIVAAITGLERIAENAHYVSDVVAGAGLGTIIGIWATRRLMDMTAKPANAIPVEKS